LILKKENKMTDTTDSHENDIGSDSNFYDAETARCHGTHLDWDDVTAKYFIHQLALYMNDTDDDGSSAALGALNLVLNVYQEESYELAIEELFCFMKFMGIGIYLFGAEHTVAGRALYELLGVLESKYPDL
jgi:hypothetical protein